MKIRIKRLTSDIPLPKFIGKGDWVDLCSAKKVELSAPFSDILKRHKEGSFRELHFEATLIPLGVAIRLPKGFEAILAPRSSSFKHFQILQTNGIGVIDNSYHGDEDEWKMPVISLGSSVIEKGDRVCQFRIQLNQRATLIQKLRWLFCRGIRIEEVPSLGDDNRNGLGSTGR